MRLICKTDHHEVWLGSHGMMEIYSATALVDVTNTATQARARVAELERT